MRAADKLRTTGAGCRGWTRVTETGNLKGRALGSGDAIARLGTCDLPLRGICKSKFYEKRRDEESRYYEYRRVSLSQSPRSIFGARLRLARLAAGLPQDKLGVKAGLDEGTASARISRYESGIHEPNIAFAHRLADELGIPAAYFYAVDDELAKLILWFGQLSTKQRKILLEFAGQLKTPS